VKQFERIASIYYLSVVMNVNTAILNNFHPKARDVIKKNKRKEDLLLLRTGELFAGQYLILEA
jgi:hypothetical protein